MLGFGAFWNWILPPYCHGRDITRLARVSQDLHRVLRGSHIDLGFCARQFDAADFLEISKQWTIVSLKFIHADWYFQSKEQRAQLTNINAMPILANPTQVTDVLRTCPHLTSIFGPITKAVFDQLLIWDLQTKLVELEIYSDGRKDELVDLSACNNLRFVSFEYAQDLPPPVSWPIEEKIDTLVLRKHTFGCLGTLGNDWLSGLTHVRTFKASGAIGLRGSFMDALAPGLETMLLTRVLYEGNVVFPRLRSLALARFPENTWTQTTFPCLEDLTIDQGSLAPRLTYCHRNWTIEQLAARLNTKMLDQGNLLRLCIDFHELDAVPILSFVIAKLPRLIALELTMVAVELPSFCSFTLQSLKFCISTLPGTKLRLSRFHAPALRNLTIHNNGSSSFVCLKIANHQSIRRRFPELQRLELRRVFPDKRLSSFRQIHVIDGSASSTWDDLR